MNIKLAYRIVFIFLVCSCTLASAEASDLQTVCSACHENPVDVLKKEHEETASFATCLSCHESGSDAGSLGDRIHIKHTEALRVSEETCLTCHMEDEKNRVVISTAKGIFFDKDDMQSLIDKYTSWNSSGELADSHRRANIGCSACHTNYDFDDSVLVADRCKSCHGDYEQLAPKTADRQRNPHKSHYGNLSCARCHQVHEPFFDYCDKCHHTAMKWNKKLK